MAERSYILDEEASQSLKNIAAQVTDEEAILDGLEDVTLGRTVPAKDAFDQIRRKHAMPS